jgi:small subunit ribosomal protein S19
MAKKEFRFKGKTIEELQQMDLGQFAELAGSRAKRSITRGLDEKLLAEVEEAYNLLKDGKLPKPIRTHKRSMIIIPKMVGLRMLVHNGKEFQNLEITEKMLGHYLGELSLTRKRLQHGKAGIGATKSSTAVTARG